jgi:mono/diheme cytochrome c family protein
MGVSSLLTRAIAALLVVPLSIAALGMAARDAVGAAPIAPHVRHLRPSAKGGEVRGPDDPAQAAGEQIYRTTCVACHGVDGTGASQSMTGFTAPLPDFSDCNFASREPAADWRAIVRDGGPVRGFSRIMPAFRDLLTPEQIRNVVAYVRTFCSATRWPRGDLNVPLAQVTEKAYPEDELVLTGSIATYGPGAFSNHLIFEKRLGARDQLELDTPFGFTNRPASTWAGAIGDISVAEKHVFFSSAASGTIVSGLGGIILPTGDQSLGLGSGTTAFEGFILGAQLLPARSFLQFQGGVEIPTQLAFAPRVASWSAALGTSVPFSEITRLWSPMIEVAGSRDLESGATTEWDVVPEFQVTLSALQHVRANVGVNIPVTQRDTRHAQVLAYILWDTFDGPLFKFWRGWCPGCQH